MTGEWAPVQVWLDRREPSCQPVSRRLLVAVEGERALAAARDDACRREASDSWGAPRGRAGRELPPHGTEARERRHRRDGESPCTLCREATSRIKRARNANRRAWGAA